MVDGLPAKPAMMAPSLVGVDVPAGRHVVRFRYAPYSHYPLLLAIGAAMLLGLALYARRSEVGALLLRRTRRPHQRPGQAAGLTTQHRAPRQ
jgi:hypothetical protein